MKEISYFERINWCWKGMKHVSLEDTLQMIKKGDLMLNDFSVGQYTLSMITEAIRQKTDSKEQNVWKGMYCPAVSFNGVWDGQKIVNYSPYTALDFDHIASNEDMVAKMDMMKMRPYTVAIFRTFKAHRFKAIVMHDNTDPARHKDMYEQIMKECGADDLDNNFKDLSRRTYLAWDKDICIKTNPVSYNYKPTIVQMPVIAVQTPKVMLRTGKQKSPRSIICILNKHWHDKHPDYWHVGNRANSIFRCACQMCEYGVPEDMAMEYFMTGGWLADDFSENEVIKQVSGAYKFKSNEYGSKIFS